jgi:WD40 repeat protein
MSAVPTTCPRCTSAEIHHRQSRGDWICDTCDHTWNPADGERGNGSVKPRARLFLSYGRRDAKDLADRLRRDLEARGYDVWQDTERIRSGKEWQEEIQDGLRSTQLMIALLSPHSVRTTGAVNNPDDLDSVCLDEITFARFARPPKPVVPVMAVPCEPPFCIYRLQYIDLCGWKEAEDQYRAGFARLVEAVEAGLRGEVHYRAWDHQLRPWDFSAFLNEKRQHFCGREWLFEEIESWRARSQERALLIVGDPGTGKSAIVAELVFRNPGGQVLAYHCCQADTKETLQPARFVRNVAAMIASQVPEYAARLSDPTVEEALSEASCTRDPASAFEAGILTPLETVAPPAGGVRYLLVDALDEALDLAEGPGRNTTIVDVLAARLERLPPWLRLLATTRKERGVLDRLRGLRAQELDAHDPRNLADIDRYIAQRLEGPGLRERLAASGKSAEQVARILRGKADGNILYVIRALEGVERDLYGFDNLDALPPGLYGLYLSFFNRHFPDEASYQPARKVLEVVVAARKPLTEKRIALATGLDRETELPRVLRRLSAYLPEQDGLYTVYHKSFADWLTAPDQRGTLHYVSAQRGHERLAALFWQEYLRGPATMSGYGRSYLPLHLLEAGRWDDLARLLTDLEFVEAKCRGERAYGLQTDYERTLDSWPGYRRYNPFDRAEVPLLPGWVAECTAALVAGTPVPHADKGAGPLLTRLQGLTDDQRNPGVETPRHSSGERIASEQFGADQGVSAALAEIRRSEGPSAARPSAATTPGSAVGRIQAFATFVTTHNHMLATVPEQTLFIARNHAADGLVAETAERLVGSRTQPWLSRDPRPPALAAHPACLRTLQGHNNRVNSVALSADGRTAVSVGSDSMVRVWDVESGLCRRTLQGHRRSVRSVAMTADCKRAVTASHDFNVRLWDVESGDCLKTLRGHTNWVSSIAVTPDGRFAVSGSFDKELRVWDLATGKCLRTIVAHDDEVRGVALTADGRLAVTGSADKKVCVWDVATGKCLRTLRGHTDAVNVVALTPDGKTALSSSKDFTVRVWDVASGTCLRVLQGFANGVNGVAVTPDGRLALSTGFDLAVRVWDVATGECLRVLPGHTAWVSEVAVTADGRLAVSAGSDHTLRVWDLAGGEPVRMLPGHSAWVCPIVLTPDGATAVSPGRDNTLRTWDVASGACLRVLEGHGNWVNAVAVTPDGLAVSASTDHTLRIWDLLRGQCLRTLTGHTDWVHFVAVTPDATTAVSVGSDRCVRVWDIASGTCRHTLTGHTDWVTYAALTPDGRTAVSGGRDGSVRIWDLVSGTCPHTLSGHTDFIESIAVSADGRLAATASNDKTVRVWDLVAGTCRHTLAGHQSFVENLTLTPDGRHVISASRDHTLRVWDLATGACLRVLEGHVYGVTGVSVTPDGRLAVSAGWDNTVRVWVIATGECLAVYPAGARVAYAWAGMDGRIVCGSSDGQVHFLKLRNVPFDRPLVTAVRLYRFAGAASPLAETITNWLPALRKWFPTQPGYDYRVTALCPGCGQRFVPSAKVLDGIAGIVSTAGLKREQPPGVSLPGEAWQNPQLASECPHCKRALRLNPFVVDNA